MKHSFALTALATASLLSAGVSAQDFTEALTSGKTALDLRLRYESVDQDNALDKAVAKTARLRLGYTTADFSDFFISADIEHIQAIGDDDYDSKVNGHTSYSAIVDPATTELNQAFIGYKGLPATVIKYGRQRIVLDNQRFIGNVGWRQNEQTYDALSVVNTGAKNLTVVAALVSNVNRIFGDEADANANAAAKGNFHVKAPVLNLNYKFEGIGDLTGYLYNLDVIDYDTLSTSTKGLRWKGNVKFGDKDSLAYVVEYAKQGDYADNTLSFEHKYKNLEVSYSHDFFSVKVQRESLGGDGLHAFQTPLATLHAFNGWADMFLSTPNNGLVDTALGFNAKLGDVNLAVVLDSYKSDVNGMNYGKEKGLLVTKPFGKNYSAGLKLARYTADDLFVDTNKLWLWGELKF